jgi:hypothetical protein
MMAGMGGELTPASSLISNNPKPQQKPQPTQTQPTLPPVIVTQDDGFIPSDDDYDYSDSEIEFDDDGNIIPSSVNTYPEKAPVFSDKPVWFDAVEKLNEAYFRTQDKTRIFDSIKPGIGKDIKEANPSPWSTLFEDITGVTFGDIADYVKSAFAPPEYHWSDDEQKTFDDMAGIRSLFHGDDEFKTGEANYYEVDRKKAEQAKARAADKAKKEAEAIAWAEKQKPIDEYYEAEKQTYKDYKYGKLDYIGKQSYDEKEIDKEFIAKFGRATDYKSMDEIEKKIPSIRKMQEEAKGPDLSSIQAFNDAISIAAKGLTQFGNILQNTQWAKSTYDPMSLYSVESRQYNGVMGAMKGIVPNELLDPFGRFTRGMMNQREQKASAGSYKRYQDVLAGEKRAAWGKAIKGFAKLDMGQIVGAIGDHRGVESIADGKMQEQRVTQDGLQTQALLNYIYPIFSVLKTGADMVGRAFNLITKAGGLVVNVFTKMKNFMGEGMTSMRKLGNPLETLTGMSYEQFQQTEMVDNYMKLQKGSVNASMEQVMTNRQNLMHAGMYNEESLVGAALLGQFDEFFMSKGGPDQVDRYYDIVNSQVANTYGGSQDQKAQTTALFNIADPSGTMARLYNDTMRQSTQAGKALRIQDIAINDPRFNTHFIDDKKSATWQFEQAQYANMLDAIDISKIQVASNLWNTFGERLYSWVHTLLDLADEIDWNKPDAGLRKVGKMVMGGVENVWNILGGKEKFEGTITSIFNMIIDGLVNVAGFFVTTFGPMILTNIFAITRNILSAAEMVFTKMSAMVNDLASLQIGAEIKDGKIKLTMSTFSSRSRDAVGEAEDKASTQFNRIAKYSKAESRGRNGLNENNPYKYSDYFDRKDWNSLSNLGHSRSKALRTLTSSILDKDTFMGMSNEERMAALATFNIFKDMPDADLTDTNVNAILQSKPYMDMVEHIRKSFLPGVSIIPDTPKSDSFNYDERGRAEPTDTHTPGPVKEWNDKRTTPEFIKALLGESFSNSVAGIGASTIDQINPTINKVEADLLNFVKNFDENKLANSLHMILTIKDGDGHSKDINVPDNSNVIKATIEKFSNSGYMNIQNIIYEQTPFGET